MSEDTKQGPCPGDPLPGTFRERHICCSQSFSPTRGLAIYKHVSKCLFPDEHFDPDGAQRASEATRHPTKTCKKCCELLTWEPGRRIWHCMTSGCDGVIWGGPAPRPNDARVDLDALDAALAKIDFTPGPWAVKPQPNTNTFTIYKPDPAPNEARGYYISSGHVQEHAEAIVAVMPVARALVAELRRLRARTEPAVPFVSAFYEAEGARRESPNPSAKIYHRHVTDLLVDVFKVEARRWIDKAIGVHVDEPVTQTEVDTLAREFAEHFVGGFNAAVDVCIAAIQKSESSSNGEQK